MGWVSRSLAVLAGALCLAMLPAAPASAQTAAQLMNPYTQLQSEMTDLRNEANGLYIETYYCPPPKPPSKREHEAAVDAMKARADAIKQRYETMKEALKKQALNPIYGPQYSAAGLDPSNPRFFQAGDQLLASVYAEIARRQAELNKAPTRPCKDEAPPEPPKKQVRTGPLSAAEEALLDDVPLSVPTFDDPVTLPTPPRFCTFAERTDWINSVFWPTAERAKQNALKAIETHARAEQRLRDVIASDREDSPRIDLARRSVETWRLEKDRRMAEHRKILDTDIPNPVDCSKPVGEIIGVLPPVTEHPDGTLTFNRPQLIWPLSIPPLPPCFMSEEARQAYMREVYFPLLDKVNENGQRRADYMWKLSEALRGILARHGSASAQYKAAEAEFNAYEAERKRAQAFHDQVSVDFYNRIRTLPICSFEAPKEIGVVPGGGVTPPPAGDGKLPPPPLNRPQFERVNDLAIPKKFCTAQERNAWMKETYDPAVEAALKNARAAQDHLAKLNALFTQYMRANSEHWAAVRAERDAWEKIAAEATQRAEALRQAYDRIMAVPIIPCGQSDGKPLEVIPGVGPGQPATQPRTPCPPTQTGDAGPCPRQGRQAINVGPNSKVGSGAQLKSKLGGMAMGALAGALGGGGGGGGGDGPDLWTCKIKDSEMTVFTDPASGVSLQVGAKRAKGDKLVIFSKIARSPDKGTFQTAFLEKPSTAQVIAPSEVGPCDLWGEWKLTVSWTRDTYVDGSLVKHEEGGWSEGGLFSVPGMVSKADAPTGLWKRMGFSNASNGAREMGTIFNLPAGQEPLTFVIHVTKPKADPVTTVPFVLTMTEGPGGTYTFTKAEEDPCPETTIPISNEPTQAREPQAAGNPPSGPPRPAPASGASTATPAPPPATGLDSLPKPNTDRDKELHTADLVRLTDGIRKLQASDLENRKALEASRCKGPEEWSKQRQKYLDAIRARLEILQRLTPIGRNRVAIKEAADAEIVRLTEEYLEVEAMPPPPPPTVCPPGEDTDVDSILDEIEEVLVPA